MNPASTAQTWRGGEGVAGFIRRNFGSPGTSSPGESAQSENPRICRFAAQAVEFLGNLSNPLEKLSCFLKFSPNSWRICRVFPEHSNLLDILRSSRGILSCFLKLVSDSRGISKILLQTALASCKMADPSANPQSRVQTGRLGCNPPASPARRQLRLQTTELRRTRI
jgi:hypothetical protein